MEQNNEIHQALKKPQTKRGKRIMDKRQPKLIENPKQTLFVRGNKSNEIVSGLMKDLKDNSVYFSKKHDIHPFDDISLIEKYCQKHDCQFFFFGNHQKKRPNNFVMGRLFDNKILDYVELGVTSYVSMDQLKSKFSEIQMHSRPVIIFQGDVFEYHPQFIKIKNLFLDFFYENVPVPALDILTGLHYAVVISGTEENLYLRTYKINFNQTQVKKSDQDNVQDTLLNIGPNVDFVIRRENWATEDVLKVAVRQPKIIKKKEDKNVTHNTIGDKMGRIYVDKQNIQALALKKRRKLKVQQKKEEKLVNLERQVNVDI